MGISFKILPGVRVTNRGVNIGPRQARVHFGYNGNVGVKHYIPMGPVSYYSYHQLNQPQLDQPQQPEKSNIDWVLLLAIGIPILLSLCLCFFLAMIAS